MIQYKQQWYNKIVMQSWQIYMVLQKSAEDDFTFSKKVKELSVIDGRRAQNCNILLSRLVWV